MSSESGHGKISTSGLTFAYDTGEIFNSYKGESTTNMVSYSEYQYVADGYTEALGGWDTHEGTMLVDASNKVPGFTNRSIKMTCVNANVYKYHFGVPLTNGQTYTISFWAKAQIAGNYDNFMLADGPGGYLIVQPSSITTLTTEFTRVKHTFSMTSRDTGTYNFATYLYGNGQVVWLTGFQVENKSQATRYQPSNGAPTSRSTTQGLLDLTGTHTIDIGNVSFTNDSKEEIIFDGTDDYISSTLTSSLSVYSLEILLYNNNAIPNDDTVIGGPSTYQTPISFNNTSNGVHLGAWTGSFTNEAIHIWNGGGATANQTYVGVGHHHLVFNWNGTTYDIFVDGIKTPTQYLGGTTPATLINATSIKIGDDSDGYTFNGKIPSIKIYNRTLSEREILNNYQHYKKRFSLPEVKDGSTSALAAPSAQYLADLGIKANGVYWLQPSGQSAFQAPVRFYLNKAMVCVMKGGNESGYVPDSPYWENTTLDNENDFTLTNGVRSKYQSYNVVPFTEFYWTMGQLDYQTTFSLSSEVSSMYVAQTRSWNSSANRSSPHFGNSIDYRSLVGADRRYTSALGTEIYLMGMDLKHEGHYGGGGGSSGGRIRVGSILDESTGNTAGEAYGNAGSAFGIGVNGGNPLKTGVCGYAGWTEPSIIGGADNWSLWVVF
jgi:hypothetical protein